MSTHHVFDKNINSKLHSEPQNAPRKNGYHTNPYSFRSTTSTSQNPTTQFSSPSPSSPNPIPSLLQKQVRHLHKTPSRSPPTGYYVPPYLARNASMDIKPFTNNNYKAPIEGESGKTFISFLLGGLWLTLGYWGWTVGRGSLESAMGCRLGG